MTRISKGLALSAASVLLVATACAGDDTTTADDVSGAVATAVSDASDAASDGVPAGSASMTYGDSRIDGEVVSCSISLDPPSAEFRVLAETAQIDVVSTGGLDVGVTVSGAEQFEGTGTIGIADGASLTSAQVSVTGTGSIADDAATPQDFAMDVTLGSC